MYVPIAFKNVHFDNLTTGFNGLQLYIKLIRSFRVVQVSIHVMLKMIMAKTIKKKTCSALNMSDE